MESRALFIHARRVLYHQAISPGTPSHFNIKAAEPEKKKVMNLPLDNFNFNTWMNSLDKGLVLYEVYCIKWM